MREQCHPLSRSDIRIVHPAGFDGRRDDDFMNSTFPESILNFFRALQSTVDSQADDENLDVIVPDAGDHGFLENMASAIRPGARFAADAPDVLLEFFP